MKNFIPSTLLLLLSAPMLWSQEEPATEGEAERVQYTLVLPEEKTPEVIKPDENNPFEAISDQNEKEGDTEENRVRDILLQMPAKGGGNGPGGMRVMLGSIRLEAGQTVPDVLPDQQVKLQVKSITPNQIEMVWIEKKPTGLPPKPFVIDVDVSPRVRYKMPDGTGKAGGIGTIRMEGLSAFNRDASSSTASTASVAATEPAPAPATTPVHAVSMEETPPAALPPTTQSAAPSNVPEASVLRMLFGNHAAKKP